VDAKAIAFLIAALFSPMTANAPVSSPPVQGSALVITRDTGPIGVVCAIHVYLDGAYAGKVDSGKTLVLHPPVGEHIVGAHPSSLCGGNLKVAQKKTEVQADRPTKLRVRFARGGGMLIEHSAL
jgi:hypothetical protein